MKKYLGKAAALALCAAFIVCIPGCGNDFFGAGKSVSVYSAEFSSKAWNGEYDAVIELNGSSAETNCPSVESSDGLVRITDKGTYLLKGRLEGRLEVDAPGSAVRLVLSGADISCADYSAIYIADAKKAYITLADGTDNSVSDGEEYELSADDDEPNAAIFGSDDIIFDGGGKLTVSGNFSSGVRSKDGIEFLGGEYFITAADNAVSGKDFVAVKDGSFTISAGGDGIKTTNADAEKGYVFISGGSFDITAAQDGIQAETTLGITGGSFAVTSGGGAASLQADPADASSGKPDGFTDKNSSESAKALKSGGNMKLSGGEFIINASEDGVHCGNDLEISGGSIEIAAGDDGIHADNAVIVSDGAVSISQSYEGVEGFNVDINGGSLSVTARNDGINAAGGSDDETSDGNSEHYISVNGGEVSVNALGDGLDSNGGLFMRGGSLYVSGPSDNGNAALDFDTEFVVKGGRLVAFGSSGMAKNADKRSKQTALLTVLEQPRNAGDEIEISLKKSGKILYSGKAEKSFDCVQISTPEMKRGETVVIKSGEAVLAEIELTGTVT